MRSLLNILNALPEALARWYFLNYIRPLIIDEIRAETAKARLKQQGIAVNQAQRYIGER